MSSSAIIEAKDVKKSFVVGANTIEVIKGVNFEIHPGDYVVFFGPSGCGKSTLLNLCSGLEDPTEGKFLVRGEEIKKYTSDQKAKFRQSKIGIVFQQFNLLKSMTVQENVALPLLASGEPRPQALKRAANLLGVFGLSKHLNNIHTELSGGQQQRVAMARALAVNPWILICDEPTGNLDSKSAEDVMEIFYHLNRKSKRTLLMVTHNPDHLKYASHVFHMKDGEIIKTQVNRSRPALKQIGDFDLTSRSLEQG
ncbi:MAG: ABC transporter ATP-binding protein [Patescibacteria group bacterium]